MPNDVYSLIPHWTQNLQGEPGGLCLAHEKGWLLAWDQSQWIYLLNSRGQVQSQAKFPGPLAQVSFADDGSAVLAAGKHGELRWLGLDLVAHWEHRLEHSLVAAALDPFGHFAAVCDNRGQVHFFDHLGKSLGRIQSPRPLLHLAFVHARPVLVGCADFGLVGAFDMAGDWAWREGLVVNIGSLSVSGDGVTLLSCFSEGLHCYGADGKSQGRIATPEPCRLVSQSYTGDKVLVGGLANKFFLLDRAGPVLARHALEKPVAALALGPVGEAIYAAQSGGRVVGVRVEKAR